MKTFARVGESFQSSGWETAPEGFIEMVGQRPGLYNIALENGEWSEERNPTLRCTKRQGQLALIELGKYVDASDHIDSIQDPIMKLKAKVEWDSDTWEMDNPFLMSLWEILGGTEQELYEAFLLANTL